MSATKFIRLCEAAAERAEQAKHIGSRIRICDGAMQGDYVITGFRGAYL